MSAISYTQAVVMTIYKNGEKLKKQDWNKREKSAMSILLFEVMIFYLTIVSTICFLITSRFVSFKTLRERAGFGGRMRY